mmetsp:Transcript_73832/g.193663  ORF Transcript_73832/g.193663 Transcript_73832/m.193663 type:complete len:185 (-) Transcript_73832:354-908(-)
MGYAGYAPGSKVADKLTPLQQALRSLPLEVAQETLALIDKLTRNIVQNPTEEKFRKVKLANPKLAAIVAAAPTFVDTMQEMGWVQTSEGLELPPSTRLNHADHVMPIIDATDHYKKAIEDAKRSAMRAGKLSEEAQQLLQKAQADRVEKALDGPVTQGSKANKLGDGPNICRAGDIGIGKSSGG